MSTKVVKYNIQAVDNYSDVLGRLESKFDASAKATMSMTDKLTELVDLLGSGMSSAAQKSAQAMDGMLSKTVESTKSAYQAIDETYQKIEERSKFAATAIAVAVGAILAGTLAGALYTVYKIIKEVSGFVAGLFTGDSYKNKYAEDLVAATKANEALALSLGTTASQASIVNEAFIAGGKSASDYATMLQTVYGQARSGNAEYERLGVAVKDQNGNFLAQEKILSNVNDVLNKYKEGWDRNQAAAALGVASAAAVAGAVALQAKGFDRARETLEAYGLVLGPLQTERAKEFEAATRAFTHNADLTADGFKRAIGDNIMPLLSDLADFFKDGWPKIVGVFRYTMAGVTTLIQGFVNALYLFTEPIVAIFETAGRSAVALGRAVWAGLKGNFGEAQTILDEARAGIATRWGEAFDGIAARSQKTWDNITLAWGMDDKGPAAAAEKAGKAWEASAKKTEQASESAYDKLMADIKKKIAGVQEELVFSRKLTEGEKILLDLQNNRYDQMSEKEKEAIENGAKLLEQLEMQLRLRANLKLNIQAQFEAQAEYDDAMSRQLETTGQSIKQGYERNEQLKIEIESIGKTASARDIAALGIEKESMLRGVLDQGQRANIENIFAEREALLKSKEAIEQQQVGFKSWFDLLEGGFKSAINGAKSFGDYIKNGLKNALYELVARPFIIQIAAQLSGASSNVVASALGGGQGGIGSILSSLFGGGGGAGGPSVSTAISNVSGAFSTFSTMLGQGAGIMQSASVATAGLGSSIAALSGPIAAVIAGSIAASRLSRSIGGALGMTPRQQERAGNWGYLGIIPGLIGGALSRPGGDKQEGGSWQRFGAGGTMDAQAYYGGFPGWTSYQHRGSNQYSDNVSKFVGNAGTAYFDIMRRLGGTSQGLTFGLDYDRDPKGTANPRMWSTLLDAMGNKLFQNFREFGRDADPNAELGTEAQRLLIAALKASEMPEAIKKLFADVDAASITGEAATKLIDTALEYAKAFEEMQAMIAGVQDAIDGLNSNGLGALRRTMDALASDVEKADVAYRALRGGDDPLAEVEAQKALMSAIMNRYNTEKKLIDDLSAQLDNIRSGQYDFRRGMQNRMNNIGFGSDNSFTALTRLGVQRGQINDTTDPTRRLAYINAALATLDDYVQEGRDAIARRFELLNREQQRQVDIQQRAISARTEGLQRELELLGDMRSVADSAAAAIRALTYSGSNPLSAGGRYDLAGRDIESLKTRLAGASGADKGNIANQLIQALQGRLSQAGELFQRPDDNYLAAYNETIRMLAEVEGIAKTDAERAIELQAQIEALTVEGNALSQSLVDYAAQQEAAQREFYASVLPMYEGLGNQGELTYALLEASGQAQLDVASRHLGVAEASRNLLSEMLGALNELRAPSGTLGGQRKGGGGEQVVVIQIDGREFGRAVVNSVSDNRRVVAQLVAS